MNTSSKSARIGGPPLNVVTSEALSFADCIANSFQAGRSASELAREFGVRKSVIEWWLAIGRLEVPYWEGEVFHLADRGALACEIADQFGYSITVARRILVHYRASNRRAREHDAWQFAQIYG